jgi:WD40 repeat protein
VIEADTVSFHHAITGRSLGDPMVVPGGCVAAVLRSDGLAAVAVGVDNAARLIRPGQVVRSWSFPDPVWSLAFHPEGRLVVATGPGASARVWDTERGQPLGPPLPHRQAGIIQAAFHPDGQTLATVGRDGTVHLWDVATGRPIGPPLTFADRVTAVAFRPDGRWLAAGVENRRLEIPPVSIR